MRIIAAIDIIDGKCVRLTRGDFNTKKVYNEDPLEVARQIEDNGLQYLHLVDLDGAKNKKIENITVLENISSKTSLKIDFGGGIRNETELRKAFNAGASQVTAGSIALTDPELFISWLPVFGREKLILGADYKEGKVATGGWLDSSDKDLTAFLEEYVKKGVRYAICTDIARDGMLRGPATELYSEILDKIEIDLIASGGVTSLKDIEDLRAIGCEGVIIGKAVYEGRITLKELGRIC